MDIRTYLELVFQPENDTNVWTCAVLAFIAAVIASRFMLGTKTRRWVTVGITVGLAVSLSYMVYIWRIAPRIYAFERDRVGILLPRFEGNPLSDNLGQQLINKHIEIELLRRMSEWHLDRLVECRVVSWKPRDAEEAQSLLDEYHAHIVLWGNVMKLQNSADFSTWIYANDICYGCSMNGLDSASVCLPMNFQGSQRVMLDDTSHSVEAFIDQVASYAVHFAIVTAKDLDPALAGELIDSLPRFNAKYSYIDHVPFVIMAGAQFLQSSGRTVEARSRFAKAFYYFEELEDKLSRGETVSGLNESVLRRFAALAKYEEGFCAFRSADTLSAIANFNIAVLVDPALGPAAVKNFYRLTGGIIDSVSYSGLTGPFFKRNHPVGMAQ